MVGSEGISRIFILEMEAIFLVSLVRISMEPLGMHGQTGLNYLIIAFILLNLIFMYLNLLLFSCYQLFCMFYAAICYNFCFLRHPNSVISLLLIGFFFIFTPYLTFAIIYTIKQLQVKTIKLQVNLLQSIKRIYENIIIKQSIKDKMTVQDSYFGQHQKSITIGALICYQMLIVPLACVCFYVLFTLNWYIICPLLLMSIMQFPLKKSQRFVSLVKKLIKPTYYFRRFMRIKQQQISPQQKILYGFHPHSIFSYTILLNMNQNQKEIPDFIGLGSGFGFNVPILGLILRLWGCSTVANTNMQRLMKQGHNLGIVPGGYEEGSLTTANQMKLFLNKRKGFVKYALKYGYTLRPVLSFGEHKAFKCLDILCPLKLFLNKFKIPIAFFFNKKYLFFVDPNIEITTIIGRGIKRDTSQEGHQPTPQQVNKYHKLYVNELVRIYQKYQYLNDNKPLVIV